METVSDNMDELETPPAIKSDDIIIHMDMKVYTEEDSDNYDENEEDTDTIHNSHEVGQNLDTDRKDFFSSILKNHGEDDCMTNFPSRENNENEDAVEKQNQPDIQQSYRTLNNNGDIKPEVNSQKRYGLRRRKEKMQVFEEFYSSAVDMQKSTNGAPSTQSELTKCLRCTKKQTEKKVFNIGKNMALPCSFCNPVNNGKVLFKCEKCNRIFSNEYELELHVEENKCRDMKGFTCDTCKQTFMDFNVLKRHIAAHLENPLQCWNCNECFDSEVLVKIHECSRKAFKTENSISETEGQFDNHPLKHQKGNYKCLTCNKLFLSQEYLDKHICNDFMIVQNCPHCKKQFRDHDEYKKHVRLHGENVRNCKNCKKKISGGKGFSRRLGTCKKCRKLSYECDYCHMKFSRLHKLQIHILNIHHGVTYKCDKCNLKFISQEDYDAHLTKSCQAEEPCCCKTCGKLFAKKDYLKKHEYIHSNVLYRCKFCHCAFMKEKSYKKHIEGMNCSKSARKIRLSEFNYKKCRICENEFEEEDSLIEHFKTDHEGENPHQCFCCDSCLPTFRDLQNHIHLHNTQKYTCNICGKPYTSQEGFRKHRLKHKGAEFKCQFCDSEFLNERRFKFHVKTCKKNPDSAYHLTEDKLSKKESRPKQSRQLHWESRIIMKRLRGDPNSGAGNNQEQPNGQDNIASIDFFDEPETDSNVRGWFDDYYKTEEDDFAFGLKKESNSKCQESSGGGTESQKERTQQPTTVLDAGFPPAENDDYGSNESSSSESSDTSSEEEEIEEVELPQNYNPKMCRICLVTFSQEYELLHHFIKVHPNKKAHKCPSCDVESPLFAQLKEHMKSHGIGMGIYNCDNCSKRFRSEKKMRSHNVRCKGLNIEAGLSDGGSKRNGQFRVDGEDCCRRCGKKFQTKCGYRRHKQLCKEKRKANKENKKVDAYEVAGGMDANLDCPSPPEKPSEEESAVVKGKDVVGTTENPADASEQDSGKGGKDGYVGEPPLDSFPCRLCEKKFQYERGIVMHFKSDHPGHKPLVCHICNMHLADKLKEHLKTHGIGEEFICELCGKRFNQKFLSKIHEMWHQGIEYKCSNCKQKFLNKEKMDKHVSENRCSNRQSLMRLPCDICGKSYRSKFGLSKHYITHTPKELRPVKNRMNCEFCGKWFETNNGLQRHRRIHTGERPFCCRFCSKAFVQEGNCKSHERIHTGEPRPRKKKSLPVEPAPYVPDLSSCVFNGVDPTANIQTGLH